MWLVFAIGFNVALCAILIYWSLPAHDAGLTSPNAQMIYNLCVGGTWATGLCAGAAVLVLLGPTFFLPHILTAIIAIGCTISSIVILVILAVMVTRFITRQEKGA